LQLQSATVISRHKTTGQLRSYNSLMKETCDLIKADGRPTYEIADAARIGRGTLYNWMRGDTFAGRVDTMVKVLVALGYTLVIEPITRH